jgi:hypothetical protein
MPSPQALTVSPGNNALRLDRVWRDDPDCISTYQPDFNNFKKKPKCVTGESHETPVFLKRRTIWNREGEHYNG